MKNNRPTSVTLVSLLFIIAGALGIFYHFGELKNLTSEVAWVFIVRLLAIVGGAFAFRGANWARWLIISWMVYHVGISFFHTRLEILIHLGFLALAFFALFNKTASAFFSSKNQPPQ